MKQHMHELTDRPHEHDVVLRRRTLLPREHGQGTGHGQRYGAPETKLGTDMNPRQSAKQLPLTVQLPASQEKVIGM